MKTRQVVFTLAAASLLATCGDPPIAPVTPIAGELMLELTAPQSTEGALLLVIHGPGAMSNLVAAGDDVVLHSRAGGDSVRVALFGRVSSGALLRFRVTDVARANEYRAAVREVSDDANRLVESHGGHVLRVLK